MYQDDPEVEVLLASIKGRVAEVERKADDYRKARTCHGLQTNSAIYSKESMSAMAFSGVCVCADAW